MEEELRWGPLGSINSRRPRDMDYPLVLIVMNHDPYKRLISAFSSSAEHYPNQHSDSFPGCRKLLSKSAFRRASFLSLTLPKSVSNKKLYKSDLPALCRLRTPVHPHNHRFFGGLWRRTLLLEYHVVEDESDSYIFSSHVRETEYTQSCCLKVQGDHVHRSDEG